MTKMTPSINICFIPSDCIKFIKSCWTDVKTLYAFQQDVRAYVGNLIYGVTLQTGVRVDLKADKNTNFIMKNKKNIK